MRGAAAVVARAFLNSPVREGRPAAIARPQHPSPSIPLLSLFRADVKVATAIVGVERTREGVTLRDADGRRYRCPCPPQFAPHILCLQLHKQLQYRAHTLIIFLGCWFFFRPSFLHFSRLCRHIFLVYIRGSFSSL